MTSTSFAPPPDRARLRSHPERAVQDIDFLHEVLNEALLCHVAFAMEGQPFVLPMAYAYRDRRVYLHGSVQSRTLRHLAEGHPACIALTLLDGLVLARSGLYHSMNYRSLTLFGWAERVDDEGEKTWALEAFVERLFPGRQAELRPTSATEQRATLVIAFQIEEFSGKRRAGGPKDPPADLDWPCWAGELPLRLQSQQARRAESCPGEAPPPLLRSPAG